MGKLKVTDFLLYRYRYTLGFVSAGVVLLSVLFLVGSFIPGGISQKEMSSVVISAETPISTLQGIHPEYIVHLPYQLLQKASISIFGVHELSIKLPSLLFAFISALFFFGVLRLWFRRNVAIITTIILATSSQFLLHAQLGSPEISYLLWGTTILYCTSMLARTKKYHTFWLLFSSLIAGLSLYSPFGLLALIALGVTCIVHPHARFIITKQPVSILILTALVFLVVITPLAIATYQSNDVLKQLIGIPSDFSTLTWASLSQAAASYIDFSNPISGDTIRPAYSLVIILLLIIGLFRLFTAKYTAKSYILTIWFIFTLLALFISQAPTIFSLTPVMLLVAFAVDYLIRSWYGLFPLNPYARVAGLIPLGVLVVGITWSGLEHFVYGYHYSTQASTAFTRDLKTIDQVVSANRDQDIYLRVSKDEQKFYQVYASSLKASARLTVTDNKAPVNQTSSQSLIITRADATLDDRTPSAVLVSRTAENANRFYLYKNGAY
jgi:hypothetical protein